MPTPTFPILPQTRCPRCNHLTDHVERPEGEDTHRPTVGSIVVCTRCAGLLAITSVGGLRELRDHEYRALSVAQLTQLADMQRAVAAGRFLRPRPPS